MVPVLSTKPCLSHFHYSLLRWWWRVGDGGIVSWYQRMKFKLWAGWHVCNAFVLQMCCFWYENPFAVLWAVPSPECPAGTVLVSVSLQTAATSCRLLMLVHTTHNKPTTQSTHIQTLSKAVFSPHSLTEMCKWVNCWPTEKNLGSKSIFQFRTSMRLWVWHCNTVMATAPLELIPVAAGKWRLSSTLMSTLKRLTDSVWV